MNYNKRILSLFIIILLSAFSCLMAQKEDKIPSNITDSIVEDNDSINRVLLQEYKIRLQEMDSIRRTDSIKREKLEERLASLRTTDNLKKEEIQNQLAAIQQREIDRVSRKKAQVDSLRSVASAYPVIGVLNDTIFSLYARLGSFKPNERAKSISARIESLYDDDFMNPDSLYISISDTYRDIMYQDIIVMTVTETDAIWNDTSIDELSRNYLQRIQESIKNARIENSFSRLVTRIGLVTLILVVLIFMIVGLNKLFTYLLNYVSTNKRRWFKKLRYRDYTFLSDEQEIKLISKIFNIFRWITIIVLIFLVIPLIFSIFPFTRGWADTLFGIFWKPTRKILLSIWNYLPNLFVIALIVIAVRYLMRLIRYFFREIRTERLKIGGFHPDWALPTFSIVRILLYAIAFVMIFPYLPGSDSPVFKGVSVFLGLLISLGSSSAIANMIAGLVITYMRPFVVGDRIKINDISGDVIEKTILVTRLKTITNEEITIPNSAILTGNTVNYSRFAQDPGLIIHTIATFGYDTPWKQVHEMLIDAALRCEDVLREPKPYVLQLELNDFYVSYKIHAYINNAKIQAKVLSELHANIQDVCSEHGIELLSPQYMAHRDGNHITIQSDQVPKDYEAPRFGVDVRDETKSEKKSDTK